MRSPILFKGFLNNNLRVLRNSRISNYNNYFINLLRSRFKFLEFAYEANYKFFKLAYEVGTLAVYKPKTNNINVNLYDSLIVFKYRITDTTKTKNNLPLYIEAEPEEIKNSGGLLPSGPLEVGKDVILYWTHSTNHYADVQRLNDVYIKRLVDLDEIIDIAVYALRMPYIITGRQTGQSISKYLEEAFNNNSVLFIDETSANKINIKQPTINADNYLTALQNQRNAIFDEALGSIGFSNLGRGETHQKERLLTDEIKVESQVTSEVLYDYIHGLEEFAKRFEDAYKQKLTPLISINGAYVDLITGHKYFKIKGAGASIEQNNQSLSDILLNDKTGAGNNVYFGRSSGSSSSSETFRTDDQKPTFYGPDNEDRRASKEWWQELDFSRYTYIPYTNPKNSNFISSLFGNVINFFRRGLNLYRSNEANLFDNSNVFDYATWVAGRNSPAFFNKFHIQQEKEEIKPTKYQIKDDIDLFQNREYASTLQYYKSMLSIYTRLGFSYTFPTFLISLLIFSAYYHQIVEHNLDELILFKNADQLSGEVDRIRNGYINNQLQQQENQFLIEFNNANYNMLEGALVGAWHRATQSPRRWKAKFESFYKPINFFTYLLSFNIVNKAVHYLFLFLIRNIIYNFAYSVSYNLIEYVSDKVNISLNPVYAHYTTVFNAALLTGYFADSKDYVSGLKYAASTTLTHHIQTVLTFVNHLNRNEKNEVIKYLMSWNESPLMSIPKDIVTYAISSIIVDKVIDIILDPYESFGKRLIKTSFKGIYHVLKGVSEYSFKTFYLLLQAIFNNSLPDLATYQILMHEAYFVLQQSYTTLQNKAGEFINEFKQDAWAATNKLMQNTATAIDQGINESSEFLFVHFDATLNLLTKVSESFYNVVYDFYKFRYQSGEVIRDMQVYLDNNILNQNPIDLAQEALERNDEAIQQKVMPLVSEFVHNIVIEGESYDQSARNVINKVEPQLYQEFKSEISIIQEQNKQDTNFLSESVNNLNIQGQEKESYSLSTSQNQIKEIYKQIQSNPITINNKILGKNLQSKVITPKPYQTRLDTTDREWSMIIKTLIDKFYRKKVLELIKDKNFNSKEVIRINSYDEIYDIIDKIIQANPRKSETYKKTLDRIKNKLAFYDTKDNIYFTLKIPTQSNIILLQQSMNSLKNEFEEENISRDNFFLYQKRFTRLSLLINLLYNYFLQ